MVKINKYGTPHFIGWKKEAMHSTTSWQEVAFWLDNIIRNIKGHMEYSESCDSK